MPFSPRRLYTGLFSHKFSHSFYPNEHRTPLVYIAGTLEVLLGADILRLKDVRRMGTPITSISGAGIFDGNFIIGIIAVLLA